MKETRRICLVVSTAFLLGLPVCSSASESKLIVIYDSGNTYPIDKYLPSRSQQLFDESSKEKEAKNRLPFKLPITTPSMQVGEVTITPQHLSQLQRPLFLIGSDDFSKAWLEKNKTKLKDIGADGLLIQAQTTEDVATMLKLANGIKLVPASAESFAERLGLSHYPVLLSKQGWEQ